MYIKYKREILLVFFFCKFIYFLFHILDLVLGALTDAVVVFVVISWTKMNKYQIYVKEANWQTNKTNIQKPEGKKLTKNEQKFKINKRKQR